MEKVELPIKTKVAAWWIRITGVGLLVLAFPAASRFAACPACVGGALMMLLTFILLGLIFLILSFFLLKRKKWAWKAIMGIFLLEIILIYPFFLSFGPLITIRFLLPQFVIPFILLLLDRKNFWKIAS